MELWQKYFSPRKLRKTSDPTESSLERLRECKKRPRENYVSIRHSKENSLNLQQQRQFIINKMLSFIRHSQKLFTPTIARNAFRFSTEVKPAEEVYKLVPAGPYRIEIQYSYDNAWVGLDSGSIVSKPLKSSATLLTVENFTAAGRILYQFLSNPTTGKYLNAGAAGNSFVATKTDATKLLCKDYGGDIFVIEQYNTSKSLTMGTEIGSKLKLADQGSLFVFHADTAK